MGSLVEDLRGRAARFVGTKVFDFRGKDRLMRSLYHPERIKGRAFAVDYFGKNYIGHTAEFVDWNVYVYGGAERAAIGALRDLIKAHPESWTLLDIGANSGTYCLPFADAVTAGFAFEPLTQTRNRLQVNLAANGIGHIKIEDCALGKADGRAEIYYATGHSNRGTSSLDARYNPTNDRSESVSVRRLDSYLSNLSTAHPLFVKIDVESTELDVLEGASRLKDFKVLMMVETVNPVVLEILRGWGFSGVSVVNDYARLRRHPLSVAFENHILSNFLVV